jgi:hypothetical protein
LTTDPKNVLRGNGLDVYVVLVISLGWLSTCNKRRWDILLYNVNGGITELNFFLFNERTETLKSVSANSSYAKFLLVITDAR